MVRWLISILFFLFFALPIHAHELQTQVIRMFADNYSVEKITIKQGDSIRFENKSAVDRWPASNIHPTHEIYPAFDPKKPVPAGQNWSFQFKDAGEFKFHDHLSPQITGNITVKPDGDFTQPSPSPAGQSPLGGAKNSWFTKFRDWLKGLFFKPSIPEDTPAIMSDQKQLRTYLQVYGAKKTVQKLFSYEQKGLGDCHEVAHKAGRIEYELQGAKAFKECSAECHSGCYHGATEAYFRDHGTANLQKDLKIICSGELNAFYSHQCLHGIGHGLMAWSSYDLFEALKNCDLLGRGAESCWSGVFMENIVGGLASNASDEEKETRDGHSTKYLNEDPQMPCSIVDEKYKSSCYFLQTSRMIVLFNSDFQKVAQECARSPEIYHSVCFQSMGRDVSPQAKNNPERAIELCQNAPEGKDRLDCLDGAVQDTFWDPAGQETALRFCEHLTAPDELMRCYMVITGRAPQVLDKAGVIAFCKKIPEQYRLYCRVD